MSRTRTHTQRSTASLALVAIAILGSSGCVDDLSDARYGIKQQAAAVAGAWKIPAATLAIGNTQYVAYDGAGAWNGGAGCAGGMTSGAIGLRDYLNANFSQISGIGGYACRQNTANTSQLSVHGTGRALDIFIPLDGGEADNGKGDVVGNWLIENAEFIGVQYIIWDRWKWNASKAAGSKDGSYGGPHPHHDHLHVEISIKASNRQTDFFKGPMTPPDPPPPTTPVQCDPGTPYNPQFCDDDGHWAESAINTIFSAGITVGCGTINNKPKFCPQDIANRAQTIVMLARASGLPTTGNPQVFTDMVGYEYAAPSANAALAYGITNGCGGTGTTFCPGDPTKRSHVAVFIVNTYALPAATQDYFDDDAGSMFEDAHNRFAEAGITMGCGTRKFCGNDEVTRAQLAVFMARIFNMGIPPHWIPEPPAPTSDTDPVVEDPPDPPVDQSTDTSPAPDTTTPADTWQPQQDTGSTPPGDTGMGVDTSADTDPTLGDVPYVDIPAQDTLGGNDGEPTVRALDSGCGCALGRSAPELPAGPRWLLLAAVAGIVVRRRRG